MYRRMIKGVIERGKTSAFLEAMREATQHQSDRGIRARTAVWSAMTGPTNAVVIASDFNTLEELEKFDDLSTEDSRFAGLRRAVRSQMVYEGADTSIHRLFYHSDGLISSEEATEPRHYMRILSGDVRPGQLRDFVSAIAVALEYQKQRGIAATTSVWSAVTGATNGISVVAEFDSMDELSRFDDMAMHDADFAQLRRAARENMVFLTSHVQILRNLI